MSFDASEIARLRALCAAATPGPWRTGNASADDFWHGKGSIMHDEKVLFVGNVNFDLAAAAAFIAAARTALPAALDEIERLREETLQDMKDALKQAYRQVGEAMSSVATPRVLLPLDETPLAKDNARLRKMITDLGIDPDAGVEK